MANLFSIIPIIFRAHRPSKTGDMLAVNIPFWIRKGYEGMTFFGTIITHSKEEAEHFNNCLDAMKNHEMIHLYQARATRDSWICFYWKYLVYWLKACRYRKHLKKTAPLSGAAMLQCRWKNACEFILHGNAPPATESVPCHQSS